MVLSKSPHKEELLTLKESQYTMRHTTQTENYYLIKKLNSKIKCGGEKLLGLLYTKHKCYH